MTSLSIAEQMFKTSLSKVNVRSQKHQQMLPPMISQQEQHLYSYIQHIPNDFFKPQINSKGDSLELSKSCEIFLLNSKMRESADDTQARVQTIDRLLEDRLVK
ncbi:hypothetical protein SS50377_28691 [Spironucleus salmonicida]|uniref:Uncharacterized protein n=1 Tax=Spironucleus salmonicida TaxID=348837 RepID=V6LU66_9EUKA|nr:hypothetical protein SS50377_28691 [Spironucleus salmonicida]|eukprot:EST44344.1 Hypothetical protein SS50377_15814 [Spironucleus salmonicida]